jgi:pimeloyl-ACP methyl ester carboxylesterase
MTTVTTLALAAARPVLTDVHLPAETHGLVLFLHGGAEYGTNLLNARTRAWHRSRWMMRQVQGRLAEQRLGVALLRYRIRGWNAGLEPDPSPVPDARWALDTLEQRYGLPVALVGHSMGGRTAVAVAGHATVRGVIALAPWLPAEDPVTPLTGKTLIAAHGTRDRITMAGATRDFVLRAGEVADASYRDMGPIGHYLLRRVAEWNRVVVDGTRQILR